jgi:hypothetical protein
VDTARVSFVIDGSFHFLGFLNLDTARMSLVIDWSFHFAGLPKHGYSKNVLYY